MSKNIRDDFSYFVRKNETHKALKELNDMGFSNSYICEILNMDIRVIGGFSAYSTSVEVNFIKLKEGFEKVSE